MCALCADDQRTIVASVHTAETTTKICTLLRKSQKGGYIVTYDERLAWLDREVTKAFDVLHGFLAERQGMLDASEGTFSGLPGHLEPCRKRYELGLSDGKTLLLVERREHAASTSST